MCGQDVAEAEDQTPEQKLHKLGMRDHVGGKEKDLSSGVLVFGMRALSLS